MTVAGCCETTGVVAPMLGGGHGFPQGRCGLMCDQLISANVVTASGKSVKVSDTKDPELFWALKGAGHNSWVVTSFEYKVFDRTERNETWSYEIFGFQGKELDSVYEVADGMNGAEVELLHFTLMVNNPDLDGEEPIILFFLVYHSTKIPSQYTSSLHALPQLSHTSGTTPSIGLPGIVGFGASQPACQPGKTWLRFPASTRRYNVPALRKMYDLFAAFPEKLAQQSTIITEGYSMHAVQAVDAASTAVPDRGNNPILAAFIAYEPSYDEEEPNAESARLGKEMQSLLAGEQRLDAYVNYAYGDEGCEAWYEKEKWRLQELRRLKEIWDPERRFGWYCYIK